MNKIQKDTVSLLNAAIHGKKIDFDINKNIDWNGIMEESKAHNVEALIYSAIGNNTLKGIDKGLVETWKKETFMSGVYQLNHIRQIHGVLYEFNKYNMPVIALKGLVLRDLYPKKELRTMGDADILVREEDLDKIKQILLDLGYEEGIISPRDISFKKGNTYIEVHWRVNHKDSFQNVEDFEKKVWENVIDVEFKGSRALSMNEDDLIIHLCMHMAKHIKTSGFGIRQLADLVLLVEQKFDLINWDQVYNKSKKYGIYKFMVVIFMICNKLFEMNIPNIFNDKNTVDSEYLNILIDKIFSNGVHGKRSITTKIATACSTIDNKEKTSILKNYINEFFPHCEYLGERYNYAKKYKILLPIAWIHRIFIGVFKKEYSIVDKIKFTISGMGISKKHNNLINWLEL